MYTQKVRLFDHQPRMQEWYDPLITGALLIVTFSMYVATLLPDIGNGDTAEFQRAAPTLGLAHPTGYPLYMLLGWIWSHLPLGGTIAWRMNLFSAAAGAGSSAVLYHCGRMLDQPRTIAAAAALACASSLTFWKQATIAEVYTLATLIQASLLLALWRWRSEQASLALVGALGGLALAHHRTAVFFLPGVVLFIWLTRPPSLREWVSVGLAFCLPLLLYLYIPLRLPPELRSWPEVWDYVTGRNLARSSFDIPRFEAEAALRLMELAQRHILPQLTVVGTALALLGVVRLRRDRASLALLLTSYGLIVLFSAVYYVFDMEVFLTPAHVIAALLLGEGAVWILSPLSPALSAKLGLFLLGIPLVLVQGNAPLVQEANAPGGVAPVRAMMAQPLPRNSLLIADWWYTYEGLRYLQQVERVRPDIEVLPTHDPLDYRGYIEQALANGRHVYLLRARTGLPLKQTPEGLLWRVHPQQMELGVATPTHIQWMNGLTLTGYSIEARSYRPGTIVSLTLAWQSRATIEPGFMLFIHLVGPDGAIWGQQDYTPSALTGAVSPDKQYVEITGPLLHPQAPPGRYRIDLGWYDGTTMRRVALADARGQPANTDVITLAEIDVVPGR